MSVPHLGKHFGMAPCRGQPNTNADSARERSDRAIAWAIGLQFLLPMVLGWLGVIVWMALIPHWTWFWVLIVIFLAVAGMYSLQTATLVRQRRSQ
jgi:hypothetical protein